MTLRGAGHHQTALGERTGMKRRLGKGHRLLSNALGWIMFPRCLRAATGKKVRPGLTSILEQVPELGKDGL